MISSRRPAQIFGPNLTTQSELSVGDVSGRGVIRIGKSCSNAQTAARDSDQTLVDINTGKSLNRQKKTFLRFRQVPHPDIPFFNWPNHPTVSAEP
ncbi:hypothetical protein DSO57_1008595 [Entomophthora muscae]|uniref:Uncharacterized protein n=1 Tax=Entomophthora muscae TaxID=34485 RepID=A0ACC2S8R7_9FUNG|nr:hypothetical protein DSO57_1008595 [Entomophthora muscae]